MKALTVEPGVNGSARLEDRPEPVPGDGEVLVSGIAVGVCGTDREIVAGAYGSAPPGQDRLVLGHESIARVLQAPDGVDLSAGDLVVGVVRRPDPVPCPACAVGQWDMCRNGRYTEHGIKQLDGFACERFVLPADAAVPVPPAMGDLAVLVEPTSIVAKAWDHIDHIGQRAAWSPRRVLVTGAGPIGLLAAMLGCQRGYDVHVLDVVSDGPKPELVRELGATYHRGPAAEAVAGADIVLECTGVSQVVLDVMTGTSPGGIVCLTGVSSGERHLRIDAGALNRELVLENDVVFGSVNANLGHYRAAVEALTLADRSWLEGLVTRRVSLRDWPSALHHRDSDVKVVIALDE